MSINLFLNFLWLTSMVTRFHIYNTGHITHYQLIWKLPISESDKNEATSQFPCSSMCDISNHLSRCKSFAWYFAVSCTLSCFYIFTYAVEDKSVLRTIWLQGMTRKFLSAEVSLEKKKTLSCWSIASCPVWTSWIFCQLSLNGILNFIMCFTNLCSQVEKSYHAIYF